MPDIRWLHISDLHFRGAANEIDQRARNSLPAYLEKIRKFYGDFNYIFITGDIVFARDRNEADIKTIAEYIHKIADVLGVNYQNICLAAGNHDLIQPDNVIKPGIEEAYKAYISPNHVHIPQDIFNYLDSTMEFYKNAYREIIGEDPNDFRQNPHFVRDMGSIYMLHLNTAFFNKSAEIVVDSAKVEQALLEALPDKPLFVMGHHPLKLLADSENERLLNMLAGRSAKLYLCGHRHAHAVQRIEPRNRNASLVETASASQDDSVHVGLQIGFQIGTYTPDTQSLNLKAFLWNERASGWYPDIAFGSDPDKIIDLPGFSFGGNPALSELTSFYDGKIREIVRNGVYDEYITRRYNIKPDSCKEIFTIESIWDFQLVNLSEDTAHYYFSINLPAEDHNFEILSFQVDCTECKETYSPALSELEDTEHKRVRKELKIDLPLQNHKVNVKFKFSYQEKLPVLYLHSSYMYPARKRHTNITIVGNEAAQWVVNATTFSAFKNTRESVPPYEIKDPSLGISENHQNNTYDFDVNNWTLPGFGYAFAITKKDHTAACWKRRDEK